ncbi:MAG: CBS domain-containing protein [Myxococcales bacterium]|nr:CBS domain-containing protein [Myxococcales bacterium]MDH5306415.1 CBS domain-containing protein [Myxococcales bacterium]MDH5565900.1 CBS domain-containing protein [Myxococcales bacterium]
MRAADIMQKQILAVSPELSLTSLEEFLSTEDISGAPVQDDRGSIIGIVSKTDLIRALSGREDSDEEVGEELTVEDIMTTEIVTVAPDDDVKSVARRMLDGKLHRVLVARDNEVLGIITTFDLLELLA